MTDAEKILGDVDRHGLTIPVLAGRGLGIERDGAGRLLETLTKSEALFRHPYGRTAYYSRSRRPLGGRALRERFAVAWCCIMGKPPKRLLAPEDLEPLLGPVLPHLGLERLPRTPSAYEPAPSLTHALYIPTEVRTGRSSHLDATMRALQRFVAASDFRPWLYLCSKGRGALTYLHPDVAQVDELRRWLVRHPLYGYFEPAAPAYAQLPHEAIAVPTHVEPLRTMRPVP